MSQTQAISPNESHWEVHCCTYLTQHDNFHFMLDLWLAIQTSH